MLHVTGCSGPEEGGRGVAWHQADEKRVSAQQQQVKVGMPRHHQHGPA